ncbi:hypothetical protein NPIL_195431 [Nephila pilipes]|uniref:Uncharacterized protein n=1 Tax=Nephila pilipes TaxID=299642 RepID=A0A8X6JH79_NEPPI|nr:hypothetical protein NPIL_195431 [Nephila pilipes]
MGKRQLSVHGCELRVQHSSSLDSSKDITTSQDWFFVFRDNGDCCANERRIGTNKKNLKQTKNRKISKMRPF